ncbi:MAG: PspC domain-containing protein [Saprospiraceae bacterium]
MNKIHNINLGGYPFTIDEDAYHELNKYLAEIENHFSSSEGCEDILDDIEARIAELFSESLDGRGIVTRKELQKVINVMGTPADFGAESTDNDFYQESKDDGSGKKKSYKKIKTGKRLYRDGEDKVIGGVCAGVASYFGIEDPIWVRLSFLAMIFIGGVSILLYPLLWVIVPEAKTAGDKLKMKGEPATVSNIAKTIEEELEELSDKITEISKGFGTKKKIMTDFFQKESSPKDSRF